MQLFRPDFTNFCDNDTTFAILLLTTICETTHKQCRGLAPPRNGTSYFCKAEIAPLPYTKILPPQNRFALCGFYSAKGYSKSGAEFLLRHRFVLFFTFICFFAFFCTACRLSPIEALPQALTGLCPVPTRGFTP